MNSNTPAIVAVARLLPLCACQRASQTPATFPGAAAAAPADGTQAAPALPQRLTDTAWRLVEMQSMDDTQGTTKPEDPSQYTMRLAADGSVTMRLNCNRATGTWSATPLPRATTGR